MATDTSNSGARVALMSAIDAALPLAPRAAEEEVVALFDQFRGGLLRYVLSLGIDLHDGEDVIQEVFLSLFRHLRLGRSRANLRGWIFRVAHNLALKQRSRAQRQQARIAAGEDLLEERFDPGANPEEQLAKSQRQRQLLLVVAALSAQDRCCLLLRAEGLRYREIADVLGMSLGAVSNSLTRSMERLMRADGR
ncbi:MAG TPA: RNA polymerase sigma factor [Verrucomicrobiae bacterium]|nr:RNA polymerase sigma factor [Verrucomicrobiae bacterium]